MKYYIFITSIFLVTLNVFSQTHFDKTIYLDSLGMETSIDNHKYYRIIKEYYKEKDFYVVTDFFKSGKIEMEGVSKTKDFISYNGEYIYYYENGNKKSLKNYKNSRLQGNFSDWYENGNKKHEGEFILNEKTNNIDFKIYQFWNKDNVSKVIDGNGDYELIEKHECAKGKIKNGYKDGSWEGNVDDIKYIEEYKNGNLISGKSIDSNKIEYFYDILQLYPKPKKGINHFYKFIARNFKIPKNLPTKSKIIVSFNIDNSGKISDITVLQSVNQEADQEAIRVISKYKDWSSGEYRGIKRKTSFTIPINIAPVE